MNERNGSIWLAAATLGLIGATAAAVAARSATRKPTGALSAPTMAALPRATSAPVTLPRASLADTITTLLDVFATNLAKGFILRRRPVMNISERTDLDARAVRRLQMLRERYGKGPLMLRLPMRKQAVLLAPEHVHRVLHGSPDPFSPASSEKRAALSHFQPEGVLISTGAERTKRRRFNEEVLDYRQEMHRLAAEFIPVVEQEAARMLAAARRAHAFDWPVFEEGWHRMVRRVVFGSAAADDHELEAVLGELRAAANWAFLHPKQKRTRKRLLARIQHYLDLGEPGSLAGLIARMPKDASTAPAQQVPQWLFAFDAAAIVSFRALALLATHPEHATQVRQEIGAGDAGAEGMHGPRRYPLLRAAVLEAARLWPTTPLILRQTTRETQWENGVMPTGSGVAIVVNYFHRDATRNTWADRFSPELWQRERGEGDWPLVPFSAGPAACAGEQLTLMLASTMLASLLGSQGGRDFRLRDSERINPQRLPATLDPYTLRFDFSN